LEKGEKNYIFVSSRKRLDKWLENAQQLFPDKKFISYTSGEGGKITNVTEEWSDVDAVFTTSTITVGINFDTKNIFHNVFISVSARAKNLVSDIFQSHYRVRNLINNKVYFHLYTQPACGLTTSRKMVVLDLEWKEGKLIAQTDFYRRAPPQIKSLIVWDTYERNMSIMKLGPMFYRFIDECGYDTRVLNLDSADELTEVEVELENEQPFEKIKILNTVEMGELQLRRNRYEKLTADEKAQYCKFKFVHIFADKNTCIVPWSRGKDIEEMWFAFINGMKKKIKFLQMEKLIRNGNITLDEFCNNGASFCDIAALSKSNSLELCELFKLTTKMGLQNFTDDVTEIPYTTVKNIISQLSCPKEYKNLLNVYNLRDQRKDKTVVEDGAPLRLVSTIYQKTCSTKIVEIGPRQIRVGGKRVKNDQRPWKGVPDNNKKYAKGIAQTVFEQIKVPDAPRAIQKRLFPLATVVDMSNHIGENPLNFL